VLIAGDSTGAELAAGMAEYAFAHPEEIRVSHSAFPGCGLSAGRDGRLHAMNDGPQWIDINGCVDQWERIPALIVTDSIDVVVACIGPWDAGVIRFPDGSEVSILDPFGRQLVADAYQRFVDTTRAAGAIPVFVRPPDLDLDWDARRDTLDDPARWSELRAIIDAIGVSQIDLPGFLAANGVAGAAGRPDGVHLTSQLRAKFVAEVVVPDVVALTAG
jgi:hypothetical protein